MCCVASWTPQNSKDQWDLATHSWLLQELEKAGSLGSSDAQSHSFPLCKTEVLAVRLGHSVVLRAVLFLASCRPCFLVRVSENMLLKGVRPIQASLLASLSGGEQTPDQGPGRKSKFFS